MYQHVLKYFRDEGLRFAHVDTGLDDAHILARRAYESVGFDRKVPAVEYWQEVEQQQSWFCARLDAASEMDALKAVGIHAVKQCSESLRLLSGARSCIDTIEIR